MSFGLLAINSNGRTEFSDRILPYTLKEVITPSKESYATADPNGHLGPTPGALNDAWIAGYSTASLETPSPLVVIDSQGHYVSSSGMANHGSYQGTLISTTKGGRGNIKLYKFSVQDLPSSTGFGLKVSSKLDTASYPLRILGAITYSEATGISTYSGQSLSGKRVGLLFSSPYLIVANTSTPQSGGNIRQAFQGLYYTNATASISTEMTGGVIVFPTFYSNAYIISNQEGTVHVVDLTGYP